MARIKFLEGIRLPRREHHTLIALAGDEYHAEAKEARIMAIVRTSRGTP